jgi:polyisoprenoid-binding protein YceI
MNYFMRFPLLGVIGASGLLLSAVASAAITGAGGTSAVFDAVGPAGLKIEGKTSQVGVAEQDGNVVITVAPGSFDTGIELRNRHMREKYLETDKYPNAVLTVPRPAIRFPPDGADASGNAPGTLNLHGQTKPVTISYKAHRAGDTYVVTGSAHVKMTDFGIAQPSYLGVTVKPDVDITVSFSAKDT